MVVGQTLPATDTPPTFAEPVPIKELHGPEVVDFDGMAELKVPAGILYYEPNSARELLKRIQNPAPKGLLGILTAQDPRERNWSAILEFKPVGHVDGQNLTGFNPDQMKKKIAETMERLDPKGAARTTVEWELEPIYLAKDHLLEFALRVTRDSASSVNHSLYLLGREGALVITTITPGVTNTLFASLPVSFKEMAKWIQFKGGHQYSDFKPTDQASTFALADLVTCDDRRDPAAAVPAEATSKDVRERSLDAFWVGIGVIGFLGCFVAVGGRLAYRKLRAKQATDRTAAPEPALAPPVTAHSEEPRTAPARRTLVAERKAKPALGKIKSRATAEANGARRRSFDYNRYFSDLLSNVYSQSYAADQPGSDGLAFDSSRISLVPGAQNGSSNGTNGDNGHNSLQQELILSQQSLLEEQRRLIQEQSRIIEEKTRLIAEKNNILKLQSQLMEHKLL